MFDINIQEIDKKNDNITLKKSINLDHNLDCFITISSTNKILAENILNQAIESIIDKISKEDTYNDFGIALETINAYIKNWKESSDNESDESIDMIIAILNENDFMFSNIGQTGVYLLNTNNQLIELTEKGENKKEFLFISNGMLTNGDIIITASINLLKYLTKSDLVDGALASDDLGIFGKNISNILHDEQVEKNALVCSIRYENEFYEEDDKLIGIKNFFLSLADFPIVKNITSFFLRITDKINTQSKGTRNSIFGGVIIGSILLLFSILSPLIKNISQTENIEHAKMTITTVEQLVATASQNISNPDSFQINIEKAEEQLAALEAEQKFQSEVTKLSEKINLLKKQFNKIEIFEVNEENTLLTKKFSKPVSIIQNNKKTYVITDKSVIGPILNGQEGQVNTFSDLQENENFVEARFLNNGNMYLLTNTSKIAQFTSNGRFSFANVTEQEKWEDTKEIANYGSNLYTLGVNNQIYKHIFGRKGFKKGNAYLKASDQKKIGDILDVSIDGGIYIVKENLEILKFFSEPYRLEEITINNLPKNFNHKNTTRFEIKSGYNLKYVYLLLNEKIWVFKTDSRNYRETTKMTYIGQIDGGKNRIVDFYPVTDTNLLILGENGIYDLNFEVSADKLLLR